MKKQITTILLSAFLLTNLSAFALSDDVAVRTEHIVLSEKAAKKSPTNVVIRTPMLNTIIEYNVIEVSFARDFESKNAREGDHIPFVITRGLRTIEGTQIVPEGTNIDSVITKVIPPKSFNRSGKVEIAFKEMTFPDGRVIPIKAKLATKKPFLSRGKLNGWGKGLGSTLGGAAIGTGAGCGIGVAASAVIIGGFAIGLPVGIAIGGIAGLVTPGLQYKAKAGDKILIQLTDNLSF